MNNIPMQSLPTAIKTSKSLLSISIAIAALGFNTMSHAESNSSDITNLWDGGKFTMDDRLRYESVNVDKPLPSDTIKNANAWTLRIRPGFQTGVWNGLSAVVEASGNININHDFNSTRNVKPIMQAWLIQKVWISLNFCSNTPTALNSISTSDANSSI